MKKTFYYAFFVLLMGLTIASCKDDTVETPLISGIETDYMLKQGAILEVSPQITNNQNAVYEWIMDGKTISKEPKLRFNPKERGTFKIKLKVSNNGGVAEYPFTVTVYGKYKYGTFILAEGNMTNETGTLSFIDPEGIAEDSIFIKANQGKKLGNVCQDMAIANGKVYIISQNGAKNGGEGKLIIANAETMKMEAVIDAGLEGWTTNISVPNDKWAYVVSTSVAQGLIPIDLSTNKAGKVITGTEKASKLKMASVNNKVFAAAGAKLLILDGATAKITKEMDMEGKICGISKTSKENIQVILSKDEAVDLITINGKDNAIIETKTIKGVKIPTFITSAFSSDTQHEGSAYMLSAEGWSVNKILKFANNATSDIFSIPSADFPNVGMFYGPISVNPETGNIYFGYVKGWGMDYLNNGIGILSPDGKKVKDYNSQSANKNDKIDTRFCAGIYFTNPYSFKK